MGRLTLIFGLCFFIGCKKDSNSEKATDQTASDLRRGVCKVVTDTALKTVVTYNDLSDDESYEAKKRVCYSTYTYDWDDSRMLYQLDPDVTLAYLCTYTDRIVYTLQAYDRPLCPGTDTVLKAACEKNSGTFQLYGSYDPTQNCTFPTSGVSTAPNGDYVYTGISSAEDYTKLREANPHYSSSLGSGGWSDLSGPYTGNTTAGIYYTCVIGNRTEYIYYNQPTFPYRTPLCPSSEAAYRPQCLDNSGTFEVHGTYDPTVCP